MLLLFAAHSAQAKVKVVESSAKKAPVWFFGSEKEAIIASSNSDISLEDAKRRVMEEVKVKMIESVAQNINFSSFSKIEQKSGDENSFSDEFKSALLVNSAKIPYISGISESKIEGFYWEISEDSETKKRSYVYSIKYPMPQAEIEKMIDEFKKKDAEMQQELEMLQSSSANVASIEQIYDAVQLSTTLADYFFDSTRRGQASNLRSKFMDLYSRITVVTAEQSLGSAIVELKMGSKKITSSKAPTLIYDREMIQDVAIVPYEGGFKLTYDARFCQEDLPYTITLRLNIGQRRVEHKVSFTRRAGAEFELYPQGTITLTAQNIESGKLTTLQLNMKLHAEGVDGDLHIEKITLKVPNLVDELYFDKINANGSSKGEYTVLAIMPSSAALSGAASSSTVKILSGEMSGYYGAKRERFSETFSRPYSCNW